MRARWALCALLGLTACSTDSTPITQIVVVVDTDLDVPDELDGLSIEVSRATGMLSANATLAKTEDLPRSLGIVYGGGPLGPLRVTVNGMHGDAAVVTRVADVSFSKNKSLRLSLMLTRSCRDLLTACSDDESCDDGACVDAAVSDLPAWNGKLPPHWSMTMSDADGGVSSAADGGGSGAAAAGGRGGNGTSHGGSGASSSGNGASGSSADNQRPVCQIDQPQDGEQFFLGDSVDLSGSCADPDGAAPVTVTWRDSVDDAAIGSMYAAHFTPSAGEHTITFCGADRRDSTLPGCKSVTITVVPLPDVTAMISSIKQGSATNPPFSADANVVASGGGSGLEPITLRWTDSLIGELGSDTMQTLPSPVTVGKHALALTVSDARSRTATATSSTFNVLASGESSLFVTYDKVNATLGTTGPVVALDADAQYIYAASQGGSSSAMTSALYKIDTANAPATVEATLVTLSLDPSLQLRDVSLHAGSMRAYIALSSGYEACNYMPPPGMGGIDVMSCVTSKTQSVKPCATGETTRVVRVSSTGNGKDYVLLGTPVGLCVCDATTVGNCDLSPAIKAVAVTSFTTASGAVWVGTNGGLYKIDLAAKDGVMKPSKVDAVPGSLTALSLGGSALWIGSVTGVTRMDPSNSSTSFWATSTSAGAFQHLISSDIRALAVSRPVLGSSGQRDVAWIATGTGVSRFDASVPSFTSFTSSDGLPSNSVRAVLVLSSGDKVFGTDSGLALYRGP